MYLKTWSRVKDDEKRRKEMKKIQNKIMELVKVTKLKNQNWLKNKF